MCNSFNTKIYRLSNHRCILYIGYEYELCPCAEKSIMMNQKENTIHVVWLPRPFWFKKHFWGNKWNKISHCLGCYKKYCANSTMSKILELMLLLGLHNMSVATTKCIKGLHFIVNMKYETMNVKFGHWLQTLFIINAQLQ